MYRLFVIIFSFLLVYSCTPEKPASPQIGIWRGELALTEDVSLPFNFELKGSENAYEMIIHNSDERIAVESFEHVGDSVLIQMSVFDSRFHLVLSTPERMEGYWNNVSRGKDYKIPFVAEFGREDRFELASSGGENLGGKWEAHFSSESPDDHYPAIGLFEQENQLLKGTFLTETGDYRYLEGVADGQKLRLSCFDGAHAFVFEADLQADTLNGKFYSGNHWVEPWYATKNENFELRDPEALTFLNDGYDKLSFTFPNLDSTLVSLEDEKYQNKVVILQLMGSWCPNCMDETKLYAKWYDKYKGDDLEIIGLAYERTTEFPTAVRNLQRLKDHFEVGYDFLVAKLSNDKLEAAETLPMLNHVMSYPTSIYIDKSGNIRKIHTGFTGPGTGDHYTRFVEKYSQFIEDLLVE